MIIADTGFLLALANHRDRHHAAAVVSLVILAEHLGHGRILSTDERDFRTYRWKRHQPFENLLAAEHRA